MALEDGYRWRFVRLRSPVTGEWAADPALRTKLVDEAKAERSSMTTVAVRILCKIYGVEFRPTGRIGRASGEGDVLNLRVPDDLDSVIAVNALAHRRSVQAEMLTALSSHYGLAMPAKAARKRRPRRPSRAAA